MNTNMTKAEEIIRLENDIMADEKLKEKLDSAVKEAINSGKCTNDADALVRAAKSLGYEISMAEMERHFAEKEEVDQEELKIITGGDANKGSYCVIVSEQPVPNEKWE